MPTEIVGKDGAVIITVASFCRCWPAFDVVGCRCKQLARGAHRAGLRSVVS